MAFNKRIACLDAVDFEHVVSGCWFNEKPKWPRHLWLWSVPLIESQLWFQYFPEDRRIGLSVPFSFRFRIWSDFVFVFMKFGWIVFEILILILMKNSWKYFVFVDIFFETNCSHILKHLLAIIVINIVIHNNGPSGRNIRRKAANWKRNNENNNKKSAERTKSDIHRIKIRASACFVRVLTHNRLYRHRPNWVICSSVIVFSPHLWRPPDHT